MEQNINIEEFKNQYATLKSKEKEIENKIEELKEEFKKIEELEFTNSKKVLDAFQE